MNAFTPVLKAGLPHPLDHRSETPLLCRFFFVCTAGQEWRVISRIIGSSEDAPVDSSWTRLLRVIQVGPQKTHIWFPLRRVNARVWYHDQRHLMKKLLFSILRT